MDKILIVEDEAIIALDLKMELGGLGYEVIGTADNGLDAINMAKEHLPDVVLMDIKLKGTIDGIEAAEIISKLGVGIIYLTANTDKETHERINGEYPIISKPFDIDKLDQTLKDVIKQNKE